MIHETAQHRLRQDKVTEFLARLWGYRYLAHGPYAPVDVHFFRDRAHVASAEIRTRPNHNFAEREVQLFDKGKWHHLITEEVFLGVPAFYVLAFPDGIFGVRVGDLPVREYARTVEGRSDRKFMPGDKETVFHVPSRHFTKYGPSDGIFDDAAPWEATRDLWPVRRPVMARTREAVRVTTPPADEVFRKY